MKTLLLSSRKLYDDPTLLDRFWDNINIFLSDKHDKDEPIMMGNFLNGNLRNRLEKDGYTLQVKKQALKSLANHNRKMIRECDHLIVIRVDNSSLMGKFASYAQAQGKVVSILDLSTKGVEV